MVVETLSLSPRHRYTALARVTFGMYGSYIPILMLVLENVVFVSQTASDFTPNMPPLGLTPGRHRIEIRDPGFETMTFDANIVAGQVLPYQGTMQRF